MRKDSTSKRGFSLIELVIVVVIIAIIAAIAIPKLSRGASGANDSATMQDLSQMRSAIDLFTTEHGGTTPSTNATTFLSQMTTYTDASGGVAANSDSTHIYGPYLKSIPPLPVGANKGLSTVTTTGPVGTGSFGWYYDGKTIWANTGSLEKDITGVLYNTY